MAKRICTTCRGIEDPQNLGLVFTDEGTPGGLGGCGDCHTFAELYQVNVFTRLTWERDGREEDVSGTVKDTGDSTGDPPGEWTKEEAEKVAQRWRSHDWIADVVIVPEGLPTLTREGDCSCQSSQAGVGQEGSCQCGLSQWRKA